MATLDELRQKYPQDQKSPSNTSMYRKQVVSIIVGLILRYGLLSISGYFCWNYLAPIFSLPTLTLAQMIVLLIFSDIVFRVK